MMLFTPREPTQEEQAEGWEPYPHNEKPCRTYVWIGQDFSFCDRCTLPCWEHPYEPGMGDKVLLRRPQRDEDAILMWNRWGKPKGITFTPPSRIRKWVS